MSARIRSLDGLRALSILMVIAAHVSRDPKLPVQLHDILFGLNIGALGVRVFFVISGFLITSILLREIEATGSIKLYNFYYRRALRLLPPLYIMLVALIAARSVGLLQLSPRSVWHAVTYTTNYVNLPEWSLAHTWSLSVEEQFYFLWPAVILLVRPRKAMAFAAVACLLSPIVRALGALLIHRDPQLTYPFGYTFETAFDAIAVGCLLAGFRTQLWSNWRYRKLVSSRAGIALLLVILVAFSVLGGTWVDAIPHHSFWYAAIGITVSNVVIALCLDRSMRFTTGMSGKILNSPPLVAVGLMSYSLYLWQQPLTIGADVWSQYPLNVILIFTIAGLSYAFIEKPFARLRAGSVTRSELSHA